MQALGGGGGGTQREGTSVNVHEYLIGFYRVAMPELIPGIISPIYLRQVLKIAI